MDNINTGVRVRQNRTKRLHGVAALAGLCLALCSGGCSSQQQLTLGPPVQQIGTGVPTSNVPTGQPVAPSANGPSTPAPEPMNQAVNDPRIPADVRAQIANHMNESQQERNQ